MRVIVAQCGNTARFWHRKSHLHYTDGIPIENETVMKGYYYSSDIVNLIVPE